MIHRHRRRAASHVVKFAAPLILLAASSTGCTGLDILLGPVLGLFGNENDNTTSDIGIAIAVPADEVTAAPGVTTQIRWADIAEREGTVVRITAQRRTAENEDDGDPIQLVGDGSQGSGRDALGDGDNDVFEWDVSGVRVGTYVIIATIESPDGVMETVESRDEDRATTGVIVVTTALPVPTLTFTAPGASDEDVLTGIGFTIQWTDNGAANPDAVLLLGLDPDSDRENGNEFILIRDQPLSENGNNGSFAFNFVDENGDTVPDDIYNVFALIDDGANDPVRVTATGQLVLNP